jgi:proteasome assembly chaperone (PAC2) family protein
MFFEASGLGKHDLLIFIGEAQPQFGGFRLCQKVIDFAASRGVTRVYTFAAMATQLQLGKKPKVFAATTDAALLGQLRGNSAEILEEGQIGGLNGVLLAAAAERQIRGVSLLGELPFFAAAVPNPRAAVAVLECFSRLSGIDVDLTRLRTRAEAAEAALVQLLEQMNLAAEEGEAGWSLDMSAAEPTATEVQPELDAQTRSHIELLFEKAAADRDKAFELKRELDRLGVFKHYEDRFLNLFRKAG